MKHSITLEWDKIIDEIKSLEGKLTDEDIQRIVENVPEIVSDQFICQNREYFMSVTDILSEIKHIKSRCARGRLFITGRNHLLNAIENGNIEGIRWIQSRERRVILQIQYAAIKKILDEHPEYLGK